MNDQALAEVKRELKRFQERVAELEACRKPVPESEQRGYGRPVRRRHYGDGCPETAAVKRSSMDLTRALAKLRRA